jgi:hypothetical protein
LIRLVCAELRTTACTPDRRVGGQWRLRLLWQQRRSAPRSRAGRRKVKRADVRAYGGVARHGHARSVPSRRGYEPILPGRRRRALCGTEIEIGMTLIGRDFGSGFLDLGRAAKSYLSSARGEMRCAAAQSRDPLADVAVTACFGRVQVRSRDPCAEKGLKGLTARAKCDDAMLPSMWPDLVSLFRRR